MAHITIDTKAPRGGEPLLHPTQLMAVFDAAFDDLNRWSAHAPAEDSYIVEATLTPLEEALALVRLALWRVEESMREKAA